MQNTGDKPISAEKIQLEDAVVWWRLRPDPLPAKSFGEILIRLRSQPKGVLKGKIDFDDSSSLPFTLSPFPLSISLETLAFAKDIRKIYLFLKANGNIKIKDVLLDGRSLLKRTRILGFWHYIRPIIISLPQALPYGSFHYLRIDTNTGERIGVVFRARDDFFPLGSYGYVTPEAYAKANCNLFASFGPLSVQQLDQLKSYGIMAISSLKGDAPPSDIISHPALWAYYLWDEPDVADYFLESLPHQLRVGGKAMEMVKRERNCYSADKNKLTFLTIDMTYKPANWFIYGRVADVSNTDPYALALGAEMRLVYEIAEIHRLASAPSLPMITYQAYFHSPIGKPSDWKYPRMPSPEEVKIMMHYALAGGAKGLLCYIYCTERMENLISYGAEDYPEVWRAIGEVYSNLKLISSILSRSQPVDGVAMGPEGVFLRALVAYDGMVLVCINERGESKREGYIPHPIEEAEIKVRIPPWMKVRMVGEVADGRLKKLSYKIDRKGELSFLLPSLTSTALVLIK